MKRDLFKFSKKHDSVELNQVIPSDNPVYEDPRDVLEDKPSKSVRKRSNPSVTSPRLTREGRAAIKEHKRNLTKKYEGLIVTLMERCEDNVLIISEKDSQVTKLKGKLKEVLEYNKLFAEENDRLKDEHSTMLSYVEDCKQVINELNEKNSKLQHRIQNSKREDSTAVPMVEVCMSCSNREILLRQSRDHNTRLHQDMKALKDVLYRLNIQLSRYQEKLRSFTKDSYDAAVIHRPDPTVLDSLINTFEYKLQDGDDQRSTRSGQEGDQPTRMVEVSGLLSAQALGPLFDAYQESIQEKENLIVDYEKQFETMNRKTKTIVEENKEQKEKLESLEEENCSLRQVMKKLSVEKETADIEKTALLERCDKCEAKLKEVYEAYEDKMSAMMRDYETVHREYFSTKNALSISENKVAQLEGVLRSSGNRTVPADLHERRVDNCKRLLEDLKHQYSMETERKNESIAKLEQDRCTLDKKYEQLCGEHDKIKEDLKEALKNIGLYRKAAGIFRQRYKTSVATIHAIRRNHRRARGPRLMSPSIAQALGRLEKIKQEIKEDQSINLWRQRQKNLKQIRNDERGLKEIVKTRAYKSLEELERRVRCQAKRSERAKEEYQRELDRATLVVEHKERIIRSLIDKVADIEEVRLSQTNSHRLQGMTDSPPQSDLQT